MLSDPSNSRMAVRFGDRLPSAAAEALRQVVELGLTPWKVLAFIGLILLATSNLTSWPSTWFDEGSHLMVPKAIVRYGVYADYDATGFRYYGPTQGVGPTVLVPIAGMFGLFGVGLLQGRLVMALYLILGALAFHALAGRLVGRGAALVAAILFVTTPGIGTLEFGRQVVGEVPGLFFLLLGLVVLAPEVRSAHLGRLLLAGLLFGLAAITKYQLLVLIFPGLGLAWLASRWCASRSVRAFLIPILTAGIVFIGWQVCLFGYLGPSSFADNFRFARQAAEGAALAFSLERMAAAGRLLLGPGMLFGAIVPALAYGVAMALRKDDRADGWRLVMAFAVTALAWFVVASVGWRRYAYPGVALACIPAAAFVVEGLGRYRPPYATLEASPPLRWTAACWVTAMVLLALAVQVPRVAIPRPQAASAMASAIDWHVPPDALIATWEPEITFLSDRRYRVPPQGLLAVAVAHVWAGGPSPSSQYDFVADGSPDYVLEGPFARGVGVFPEAVIRRDFELVETLGSYTLFRRKN